MENTSHTMSCDMFSVYLLYSCFLSHSGAFWGAFLAPVLLIMVFNVIIFVCVIFVLIRHIRGTAARSKQKMEYNKVAQLMFRIGGVMSLFGLTWLFAILTVSVHGLRETFQILFVIFNSFQGFFIFLFFCVLNKEALESWRELFSCVKKLRFQKLNLISKFSLRKDTTTSGAEMSSCYTSNTESKPSLQLSTLNSRVPSNTNVKSPSPSKSSRVLGLGDIPESSTFHTAPSKPTFIT